MKYLIVLLLAAFSLCEMVNEGVFLRENSYLSDLDMNTSASFEVYSNLKYTIDLPSIPSTGYTWVLQNYTSDLLEFKAENNTGIFIEPGNSLENALGRQLFPFFAKDEGSVKLTFINMPMWVNETDADIGSFKVYEVNLDLDDC